MKNLKFRVWDIYNKIWLNPETFSVGCDDGRLRNKKCAGCIGGVEIIQYTGLKDKNGADCYEGDILELTNCSSERPIRFEVIWSQKSASFRLKQISNLKKYSNRVMPFNACKIIGNRYESPDLLKGTDND